MRYNVDDYSWARVSDVDHGEFQAYAHDMAYGVIVESIQIVLDALHDNFVNEWVKLPNCKEALEEATRFNLISGFPPLIYAAIDGTHIPVSHATYLSYLLSITNPLTHQDF